jgi:hypothetical protein
MKNKKRTVDPDKGLELKEEIIQRLKANKANRKPGIPMEEVAKKYGLNLSYKKPRRRAER